MNLVSFHSDLAVRSTTPLGCLFLLYSTTPLGCLLHIRPLGCLLRIGPLGYLLRTGPLGYLFAGKISADNGGTVLFDLLDSTFGDDRAALCTGFRPHLDEPVRLFQDLGVMVHQKDGIADRAGQLHSLPFAGGQCRRRSVQSQITEAKVHQSGSDFQIRLADIAGHRPHLFRQRIRNFLHPLDRILQGHLAGLIEGDPHQFRRSCLLGQSRASALRADVLLEEFLHPLHPLFIFSSFTLFSALSTVAVAL